jgi:hypothetical protein
VTRPPRFAEGRTIQAAWQSAATQLVASGPSGTLIVRIDEPLVDNELALQRFDPKRLAPRDMSVFDVANTIFPKRSPRWDLPVASFMAHYIAVYERAKHRSSGWGFYFSRIAAFGRGRINQLERTIDGLSAWGRNHRAAFVMHISSADTDRPRPRGGPCLQYLQFDAGDPRLSLTAVYRSHDYFSKALGNFLGLSRLLSYVAMKTAREPGTLTCVSTHAFYSGTRTRIEKLIGAL